MNNDIKTTEQVFDQWSIYQEVVEQNVMCHKEIYRCLSDILTTRFKDAAFSLLDLACGDAFYMAKILQNTNISHYCGVDTSRVALDMARNNIGKMGLSYSFFEKDLSQFVQETEKTFDVVIIGHSLHHFDHEQKDEILHIINNILNRSGILIVFDIMRKEGETRQEFSCRNYAHTAKLVCEALNKDELEHVEKHIMTKDCPETVETFTELLKQNGFCDIKMSFRDKEDLFVLVVCQK